MKNIKKIKSKEELNKILNENFNKIVLLKFQAVWCGPCKVYKNNIEQLPNEIWNNLVVAEADVDETELLTSEYNVRNIPYTIFFKNSKEIERFAGLMTTDSLITKIKNMIK